MTEAERIDFIIRHLEGGSASAFAERIGISKANASKMKSGAIGIRLNINSILEAYPQIRRDWLETGEGYPGDISVELVRSHYEAKIKRNEMIIDNLIQRISELERKL